MLESLKEYFSSTTNTAAQRVSNPVFGAFALSWSAFNWKSILYLLMSDSSIIDKITYISDNSSWKTVALYPCLSVVVLCGGLPWINNLISVWQAKPLDNNDSIENQRKAKLILRATRLQRLKAKHDVTYDKVKTGDEINIQKMKEQITQSQERMGEITAERDMALSDFIALSKKFEQLKESTERFKSEAIHFKDLSDQQKTEIENLSEQLKAMNEIYKKVKNNRNITNDPGDAIKALQIGAGLMERIKHTDRNQ